MTKDGLSDQDNGWKRGIINQEQYHFSEKGQALSMRSQVESKAEAYLQEEGKEELNKHIQLHRTAVCLCDQTCVRQLQTRADEIGQANNDFSSRHKELLDVRMTTFLPLSKCTKEKVSFTNPPGLM